MAVILAFKADPRKRARPPSSGLPKGEIVFFSGARIDRSAVKPGPDLDRPNRDIKPGRSY
jgi:hypothetical protein